jgi:hypothetical protein
MKNQFLQGDHGNRLSYLHRNVWREHLLAGAVPEQISMQLAAYYLALKQFRSYAARARQLSGSGGVE